MTIDTELLREVRASVFDIRSAVDQIQRSTEHHAENMDDVRDAVGTLRARVDAHEERLARFDTRIREHEIWKTRISGAWAAIAIIAGIVATAITIGLKLLGK